MGSPAIANILEFDRVGACGGAPSPMIDRWDLSTWKVLPMRQKMSGRYSIGRILSMNDLPITGMRRFKIFTTGYIDNNYLN